MITITVGWWMLPASVTLVGWGFLQYWRGIRIDAAKGTPEHTIAALLNLLVVCGFVIANLTAWLIWAIFA